MSPLTSSAQDLNWLITNFVERVPAVAHAIVVSADGLPLAFSAGFPEDRADHLAAVTSGVTSLTQGAAASAGVDDLSHVPDKTTTTVAMDFGRVTLDAGLILYLFGTPGQHRFWFMWDDLIQGAIGAVVLVDTRRLADSFPAVDYFETAGLPFIVGINGFHGRFPHDASDVQDALSVSPGVPIIRCDARRRASVKNTLISLVQHAMTTQLSMR